MDDGRSLQQAALGSWQKEKGKKFWPTSWSAYLARCVDYFGSKIIAPMLDHFAECVFDGGVVAIHKVFVDELHCQRGFAWRESR
jgi:hypothetical protein